MVPRQDHVYYPILDERQNRRGGLYHDLERRAMPKTATWGRASGSIGDYGKIRGSHRPPALARRPADSDPSNSSRNDFPILPRLFYTLRLNSLPGSISRYPFQGLPEAIGARSVSGRRSHVQRQSPPGRRRGAQQRSRSSSVAERLLARRGISAVEALAHRSFGSGCGAWRENGAIRHETGRP